MTTTDRSKEGRFAREVQYLKEVYKALGGPGVEQNMSARTIAVNMGWTGGDGGHAARYVKQFEEIGLLTRKISMGPGGKTSLWQLQYPLDEALPILYKDQDSRRESEHATRTAAGRRRWNPEPETTKAIVGPDAPTVADVMPKEVRDLRKDETGALVEAARQYATRTITVQNKLKDLAATMADLGIAFDIEKAQESFHFEEDERLEAIALVLPMIDRLERQAGTLATQVAEMREKVRDYDRMKNENDRLVRRVETLVSQRVVQAQVQ